MSARTCSRRRPARDPPPLGGSEGAFRFGTGRAGPLPQHRGAGARKALIPGTDRAALPVPRMTAASLPRQRLSSCLDTAGESETGGMHVNAGAPSAIEAGMCLARNDSPGGTAARELAPDPKPVSASRGRRPRPCAPWFGTHCVAARAPSGGSGSGPSPGRHPRWTARADAVVRSPAHRRQGGVGEGLGRGERKGLGEVARSRPFGTHRHHQNP